MPAEQVNDAAFAEHRERDLRPALPAVLAKERAGNAMHPRVAIRDQAIQVASAPPGREVQPKIERCGDSPDHLDGHLGDVTTFGTRDARGRDAGSHREVDLPPTPSKAEGPDDCTDTLVVHGCECGARHSPRAHLTPARWRRSRYPCVRPSRPAARAGDGPREAGKERRIVRRTTRDELAPDLRSADGAADWRR